MTQDIKNIEHRIQETEERIIRVFPRRTKWTPDDDLAFVGEPPLFKLPELPVFISVAFTWDIKEGKRLSHEWRNRFDYVSLGGPALGGFWGNFVPGRFLKEGVTFTSRGCPKNCTWCLVPKREGRLREINIAPGHIVQDNNLLACSRGHIEAVFEMLSHNRKGAVFSGGLDIDYLQNWHVEALKKIKVNEIWVACDTAADLNRLDKAADMFSDFPEEKKRCYVMIGFNGESARDAEARCEAVYSKGFLPFAQLYRDSGDLLNWSKEFKALHRKWARPAMYRPRKIRKS